MANLASACAPSPLQCATYRRNQMQKCVRAQPVLRAARPRIVRVSAAISEAAEKVAVNILLGAVGVQWVGMGALVVAAPFLRGGKKEPMDWKDIYEELSQQKMNTIDSQKARDLLKWRGATLVDVRAADQQERNSVAEAESFPLYRPIQGSDLASNAKRAAFGWVGTYGNEFNDDWVDDMKQAFPNKGKPLILMCASGGSMEAKPGAATGFQSRSLKAVYYLKKAGYKNVYHLEGGSTQWAK
ncbi:hypothetical protein CYMTET_5983 [Cymbomonas tetramitiformis]|uniref:Rhodanese domain-containing protein n=1 Tax=Cymbomonas tetramitiformis TaxID=36881 RepID=A0AAE0GYL5_9CHLO|nr:hypothetical protein CYMTET_5983 [Cymbomonas tetramitiformis]